MTEPEQPVVAQPLRAALERLANAVLDRPFADPDDDAAKAARAALKLLAKVHDEADMTGHNHRDDQVRTPTFPTYREACPMGCDDTMPASEWRTAYFAFARIAMAQLDECRDALGHPQVKRPRPIHEAIDRALRLGQRTIGNPPDRDPVRPLELNADQMAGNNVVRERKAGGPMTYRTVADKPVERPE